MPTRKQPEKSTKKETSTVRAKSKAKSPGVKPASKKAAPKAAALRAKPANKAPVKKALTKKSPAKKVAKKAAPVAKVAAPRAPRRTKAAVSAAAQERLREQSRQAAAAAHAGALVNHVALVVDRSGSMRNIRAKVINVFNTQLAAMKKSSEELGQETFVSFYTFHSVVDAPRFFARPIKQVDNLTALSCTGLTALLDATGQAIIDLENIDGSGLENVSFLIVVLTDGHENHSSRYKSKIKAMIQRAQDTGRWTFAFLTPKGGEALLQRFGIPSGNIQAWQTTAQGLKNLGQDMQRGLQTFYEARQKGQRAVVGVFTTNLKDVAAEDVRAALVDASSEFLRIPVRSDGAIRALVDAELGGSGRYRTGHGFYELTKPELVQERKEIAIVQNATGKIYAGDAARTLLGLPVGERCKVRPGDHGNFTLFVQSTSVNRRLLRGTTLLYRKP